MMIPDVSKIMDYESGNMGFEDTVEFFAEMIQTGAVWQLQGMYGRQAADFIRGGLISHTGEVNHDALDRYMEAYY